MAYDDDRQKLLDAEAASGAPVFSEWFNAALFDEMSFHIFGMGAGDEVTIQKTNETGDSPSNPVEEVVFTGAGPHYHHQTDKPVQVRVGVTADGGNASNVTAILHAVKEH